MPRLHISQKMSTNKKVMTAIAIILTIALLMGGALAYNNFKQHAINRFHGSGSPDILLHDDFDGENKHVYVENTGDSPMIVRVQFAEYLQIGNKPITPNIINPSEPCKVTDPLTWPIRTFDNPPGPGGVMPPDAPVNDFYHHIWYMTGKGGTDKIYKPGTGEMGYFDFSIDKIFEDGTKADYTLPANEIMMLADYLAVRDDPLFDDSKGRWVLDTDGWCYWTKLLEPGKATNLLLEKVIVNSNFKPDDNYHYAIDVRLQSTNVTEAHMFDKVIISTDGKKLIEIITEGTGGGDPGGGTLPEDAIGVGLDKTLVSTLTGTVEWSIDYSSVKDRDGNPITDPDILDLIDVDEDTGTVSVGLGVPLGVTFTVEASDGSAASPQLFPLTIDRLYFSAIPDTAFRNYLSDNFGNGTMVTMIQADLVTSMNPTGLGIGRLDGIEYFSNLETLNCSNNLITSINIRGLKKLTTLNCSSNNIEGTMDFSGLSKLDSLNCSHNGIGNGFLRLTGTVFDDGTNNQNPPGAIIVPQANGPRPVVLY